MWQKAFHVVLVTFLVVFTAAALVLLVAGLSAFIFPSGSHNAVFAYSGGVTIPALKFIGLLVLFSSLVVISVVARRRRLR